MNDHDRPVRHPAIEMAEFDGEGVLYDERSGAVHELNASAWAIWILLDGRPVSDIVNELSEVTGSAPADIRADVHRTIGDFHTAGLLAS